MSKEAPHSSAENRLDGADSDIGLIDEITKGREAAFVRLFERHGERVFRYAWRLTRDQGKAEEVTNDVMLQVWNGASEFAGRSAVTTWLLGITRNLAFNSIRRKQLETVELGSAPEPIDETAAADTQIALRSEQSLRSAIRRALGSLSIEHRDVVELTFFHELSYPEIAELIDVPVGTVKTRMYHAKRQLKTLLQSQALDLPFGGLESVTQEQEVTR